MPKQYTPPAPFNDSAEFIDIPLQPVESSQVRAIGYDEATRTLAVTFVHGIGSVYQYQSVDPQVHADFIAAESIGKFFGKQIKSLPFKKFPAPGAA